MSPFRLWRPPQPVPRAGPWLRVCASGLAPAGPSALASALALFAALLLVAILGTTLGTTVAGAAPKNRQLSIEKKPPAQGQCPSVVGAPVTDDNAQLVDAPPVMLKPGMLIEADQLLMLRRLLPPAIWQHREVFFFEGMRMEVGGCHRRYATFTPYRKASERFAGQPRVNKAGDLLDYTAGLPFPPAEIDVESRDAAIKWAWNMENRFRGAGYRGRFRITEIPARVGGILAYEGSFFYVQTSGRSDLPDSNYRVEGQKDKLWASGGRFTSPFNSRHLAWRQFRPPKATGRYREPDNMFVYLPTMRKQRRAATNWVDGLFIPNYISGDEGAGGAMAFGVDGQAGAINPTAGVSIAASQDKGNGLTGISLRPNAYAWRYLGAQTVLAPINGSRGGYPQEEKRNFGYSGLSVASDRWDVRYAVVIEGATRVRDASTKAVEIWIDYQTRQPLYWIARTHRRRLQDIGIFVHRFTGDIAGHPEWPGGIPASVFEPVATVFYDALAGGGGWRRESYDLSSLPFRKGERRGMTSADNLGKGR